MITETIRPTIGAVTFSRARLRAHRDGRRLSRAGVAATAGLEPAALIDIEEGRVDPSEAVVARLAAALGIARGDLVPTRGDRAEDDIEVVINYRPAGRWAASHSRRSVSGPSRSGSW